MATRKFRSTEDKQRLVKEFSEKVASGTSKIEAARELKVNINQLRNWADGKGLGGLSARAVRAHATRGAKGKRKYTKHATTAFQDIHIPNFASDRVLVVFGNAEVVSKALSLISQN